jgi:DNA ligase 1
VLLAEVALTSAAVARTAARLAKVALLADCLRRARPDEIAVAVAYLAGELPHAPIGIGWAALRSLPAAAAEPTLELLAVDRALRRIGAEAGPGSQARRRELLRMLFAAATDAEQGFLRRLLTGELRQGALEGVVVEAVARAAGLPAGDVRRALMLAGDLGPVATAAAREGGDGLARFRLELFRPVQPMLAQTADDLGAALARTGPAAIEWKLDGARIQVHRRGDAVRVYTRNLADVTPRVPEIVADVRALPLAAAVLDGEAIALRPDGAPYPFQVTMSRFGTRRPAGEGLGAVALSAVFFDVLHLDGDDLLHRPACERFRALEDRLPDRLAVRSVTTDDVAAAERFLADALAHGHEGVMVKSLGAPYEAGRRGAAWLKVKPAHTLDLVVLAAEWGHGRRQGWLSNLHLGARDPATGGWVMLGKTFKGMSDEMLAWQTERLLELETGRSGITVHVRPELVVEVAFDGLQTSTRYPGGLALRFARIKGYRPDRRPEDADTIETVRALRPSA